MKIDKEQRDLLKKLGFEPEVDVISKQETGWWNLKCGWGFREDGIRGFRHLIQRILNSSYDDGYEDGYDVAERKFKKGVK